MPVTDADVERLIRSFASGETMAEMPSVVDVFTAPPLNPPSSVQIAFVGSQQLEAFAEAASFVRVADQWSIRHRRRSLQDNSNVVDFGSGWGRISRFLLAYVPPTAVYALDGRRPNDRSHRFNAPWRECSDGCAFPTDRAPRPDGRNSPGIQCLLSPLTCGPRGLGDGVRADHLARRDGVGHTP